MGTPVQIEGAWQFIAETEVKHTPEFVVKAYQAISNPYRQRCLASQIKTGTVPISGLFYHRVADRQPTPWTISRRNFQLQIKWLKENFDLLSMDQAVDRIESGFNDRPAVVITFDDGYAENMDFAMPLLVDYGVPCMYYVATRQILNQQLFDNDRNFETPLYPNSLRDLKKLVRWGIDIGAHTRNHVDLGKVTSTPQLRDEIEGCRRELMHLLDCPIDHFAFPFGQYSNITTQAVQLAKEAGYRSVSGAYGGYNFVGQDPFFFQRLHGDPSLTRIKNWTTIDPRFLKVKPEPSWFQASDLQREAPSFPSSTASGSANVSDKDSNANAGIPAEQVPDAGASFPSVSLTTHLDSQQSTH